MKTEIRETIAGHRITLEPESPEEVALLVRIGINRTNKIDYSVNVYRNLAVYGYITIGEHKYPTNEVPRKSGAK